MKEDPHPKATMFKLSQNSKEPEKPTQLIRGSSLTFLLPLFFEKKKCRPSGGKCPLQERDDVEQTFKQSFATPKNITNKQ